MSGKIFVNYRRDDDPSAAARVRDGLAASFGKSSIFMDVDNLLAGQRFDEELTKALTACDVLIAIIGPKWMDLLKARSSSGERDFVREEIAAALQRKIIVIPVRVGREGQLIRLPNPTGLPEDVRDLVHYQKHDVTHERYGRDIADLIQAISTVRQSQLPPPQRVARWRLGRWIGIAAVALAAVYAVANYPGAQVSSPVPDKSNGKNDIIEFGIGRDGIPFERRRAQ